MSEALIEDVNILIRKMIENPKISNKAVLKYVKEECQETRLRPSTLGMLFEIVAGVEYDVSDPTSCFSREVTIEELAKVHKDFITTNGCQWARSHNGYLGTRYNIKRFLKNGKVSSIKLDGPNNNSVEKYRGINNEIKKVLSNQRCVFLDTSSNIEIDHKNGKYNELNNLSADTQKLEDFQPVAKTANDAKREHCKKCKETGNRYDARRLGFAEGWIAGDEHTKVCAGCYLYDPVKFRQEISKGFSKCK